MPAISHDDLAMTPFGQALGAELASAALEKLERCELTAGDVLFRQGDAADRLYIVVSGRLFSHVCGDAGEAQVVGEVGPGDFVGASAVLMGTPRAATVEARERCVLAALDVGVWGEMTSVHPGMEPVVARAAEWRGQTEDVRLHRPDALWISAWLAGVQLAAGTGPAALAALECELEWQVLRGGETLVRQDDAGDAMWFVVRGRLRASMRRDDRSDHIVEEIRPGDCVGELAMLSNAPRPATVRAVRDTELLRLRRAAFERLVAAHPAAMLWISRAIVARMERSLQPCPQPPEEQTIAVVAHGPEVPLRPFADLLFEALSPFAQTALLDGTAERRTEHLTAGAGPRIIVTLCHAADEAWTTKWVRQADDVVVVARAGTDPRPGPFEVGALTAAADRGAGRHLVLLHGAGSVPCRTSAWLAERPGVQHHHVRSGMGADHERVARRLSGRATGLALSGGGARGFAHIGVIAALAEANVPIDLVAGTSMGAGVGALHALGCAPSEMRERSKAWARERPWADYTLPVASILRGRRMRRALLKLLGEGQIEDLWLPLACVTANLTRATSDVHTTGPLSLLVQASSAVPGVAPPVALDGAFHVDGGVLDNLPVAPLRAMGAGRVIAVDVRSDPRLEAPIDPAGVPSGWALLGDGLRRRPRRAPPVFESITRAFMLASNARARAAGLAADLVIRPALEGYSWAAFNEVDGLADIGFHHARAILASWTGAHAATPGVPAGKWRAP